MSFTSILQADAAAMINAEEFAETITYTAKGDNARSISAIVDRSPPVRQNSDGTTFVPKVTIHVRNHATLGISSATLNASGNDTITVAVRVGATPETLGLYIPKNMEWHDAAWVTLDAN